jgi:hypothetical protein
MLRIVLVVLGLMFLVGIPRFVKSPWFDDRYITDSEKQGGRLIRIELKDAALFTMGPRGRNAELTVTSLDGGERVSLTCVIRSVSLTPAGGEIETVPGSYCPYSSIPVRFADFGSVSLQLRGQVITANREYRRNPVHVLIEWLKWKSSPYGVDLFAVKEA